MEDMEINPEFWKGKRVIITGHTGFKGGWLALWLYKMGAKIGGYALKPPTDPNFFYITKTFECLTTSIIDDIRDIDALFSAVNSFQPEIIFHLAAQPLVRYSYTNPLETYAINVMGTINLLEIIRRISCVRAVVIVTSDKCYENQERIWSYRENEPLGGYDPYSSSKACAEILTSAWRRSYLEGKGIAVATVRAGNVIAGGDWASDRLIPDIMRAVSTGKILHIRSPEAIRPWQHVLEPLSGYLRLAEYLVTQGCVYAEAWNFGPNNEDGRSVRYIVERFIKTYPELRCDYDKQIELHEAQYLSLDSSKAQTRLGWIPRWRLDKAMDKTIEWYLAWQSGKNMREISLNQISEYEGWHD